MTVHYVTYATHFEGSLTNLIEQSNKKSIEIKVLGLGDKWISFTQRFPAILKFIQTLPDDHIVFAMDAFDVSINENANVSKAVDYFVKSGAGILFSYENTNSNIIYDYCTRKRQPNVEYVANAGLYVGYVKYIKILLNSLIMNQYGCKDDQIIINQVISKYPWVVVDSSEKLFKTYVGGGNYINKNEENTVLFIHRPGNVTFNRYLIRGFYENAQFFLPEITVIFIALSSFIVYLFKIPQKYYKYFILLYLIMFVYVDKSCVNLI